MTPDPTEVPTEEGPIDDAQFDDVQLDCDVIIEGDSDE